MIRCLLVDDDHLSDFNQKTIKGGDFILINKKLSLTAELVALGQELLKNSLRREQLLSPPIQAMTRQLKRSKRNIRFMQISYF